VVSSDLAALLTGAMLDAPRARGVARCRGEHYTPESIEGAKALGSLALAPDVMRRECRADRTMPPLSCAIPTHGAPR
jgi:hypothetical protein